MSDVFSNAQRSQIMSRVKGVDTVPELTVRSLIHRMGFRFRLHCRDLPGIPDIVLPRLKKIILVHGCFWHGHPDCRRSARPQNNAAFWREKLDRNIARDKKNLQRLHDLGWCTLILWECQIKSIGELEKKLEGFLYD